MPFEQRSESMAEEEKRNAESVHSALLNAVSHKRGQALALTLNTVLEMGSYEDGKPKPVGGHLAAQIAAVFDQLTVEKQAERESAAFFKAF